MQVIHPPVKPDPRMRWPLWEAAGMIRLAYDQRAGVRQSWPPLPVVMALLAGLAIGWGLR
jgi:hypothetical protein